MDRRRITGIGLGALAGAAYGTGPLFFKAYVYPAGVDWLAMLVWRFAFAAIVSWVWLLAQPRARAELVLLDRRTVGRLLFTGAFFLLNASVYYAAIERIDTSLVALLMSIYPALVAVVSLRLGYKFEGRLAWGALAIVILGTILTVGGVNPNTNQGGIVLALLSPVAYAGYIVLTAWMAGERTGQTADMRSRGRGAEVSPPVAGAVMMTGTFLATLVVGVLAREPLLPTQIPSAAWPGLAGIGIFAAAVAIQAFYASAARIGAAQASLMATVEPIVVIFLGITFLDEAFAPIRVVGAAVVLTGVLLAQFATPSESRPVVLEEP
jgi:drug/metabolite transporter (DMT)-like permease